MDTQMDRGDRNITGKADRKIQMKRQTHGQEDGQINKHKNIPPSTQRCAEGGCIYPPCRIKEDSPPSPSYTHLDKRLQCFIPLITPRIKPRGYQVLNFCQIPLHATVQSTLEQHLYQKCSKRYFVLFCKCFYLNPLEDQINDVVFLLQFILPCQLYF